jgi:hypothetical protein
MAPRAISSCSINIGMITTAGKLYGIRETAGEREAKTFMVDAGGHKVIQGYHCAERTCTEPDTGWTTGELTGRGVMNGKKVEVIDPVVLAAIAATAADSKGQLDLWISPATEIEAATLATGGTYWFEPEKSDDAYTFIAGQVENPDLAFYGKMTLRGVARFYRVVPHNGGVLLEELLWPDEVVAHVAPARTVIAPKNVSMGNDLVAKLTETFDPANFTNEALAQRLAMATTARGGATVTPITAGKTAATEPDNMFAAALAVAVAKSA